MWKQLKKRILPLLVAISLCMALSVTANAATARYINELAADSELSTSNGQAVMYTFVGGSIDVSIIIVTQVLQKKDGDTFKDVAGTASTHTSYKNYASVEDTVSFTGAGTYRVRAACTVTSPRGVDTHTEYSNTITRKS